MVLLFKIKLFALSITQEIPIEMLIDQTVWIYDSLSATASFYSLPTGKWKSRFLQYFNCMIFHMLRETNKLSFDIKHLKWEQIKYTAKLPFH